MILENEGNMLESYPEVGKRQWDLGHRGGLALIRAHSSTGTRSEDRIHGHRGEWKFSSNCFYFLIEIRSKVFI